MSRPPRYKTIQQPEQSLHKGLLTGNCARSTEKSKVITLRSVKEAKRYCCHVALNYPVSFQISANVGEDMSQ